MTADANQELNAVVKTIQSTVHAQEIYLFGSFAEHREQLDSDFDIYVALEPDEIRPIKAIQNIS